MKVLLQDKQTALYFAGPERWVREVHEALNLETIQRATQVYEAEKFPFAEIIVEEPSTTAGLSVPAVSP